MSKSNKTKRVEIRVSEFEKNVLSELAELKGMTLSEYIRVQLLSSIESTSCDSPTSHPQDISAPCGCIH